MNGSNDSQKELDAELAHRNRTDAVFAEVFPEYWNSNAELIDQPTEFNCLRYMVNTHDAYCTPFEDYSL